MMFSKVGQFHQRPAPVSFAMLAALAALVATSACRQAAPDAAEKAVAAEAAARPGGAAVAAKPPGTGPAQAGAAIGEGSEELAAAEAGAPGSPVAGAKGAQLPGHGGDPEERGPTASNEADSDSAEDDEDAQDVDHWKGVPFDVHNFDEVYDYVQTYYIDKGADQKRAWIEAANFALLYVDPPEELVPASFHRTRAGIVDEEGRLDGKVEAFACKGQAMAEVMLHHVPNETYLKQMRTIKKRGRLSNEEVLAIRTRQKARNLAYNEAWKPIGFARPQFECVMAYVAARVPMLQAQLDKEAAERKARTPAQAAKAAASGKQVTAPAPGPPTKGKGGPGENAARGDTTVKPTLPPEDKATAKKAAVAKAKVAAAEAAKAKETAPTKPAAEEKKAPVEAPAVAKAPAAAPTVGPNDRIPDDEEGAKDKPRLDMNRAWLAASSGFLYALDPHSSVINRAAWDQSTKQTQDASFEGIGAVLTQRDDVTVVENPMEGRPAWRAGVRAGDVIHKVDGVDVSGWMLSKVVKLIRGPKATKVVLTVSRESEPEPREVAITREAIDIKNVDGHLIKEYPGIAHVKMSGFIPRSTTDLRDMIDKLAKQAPNGQLVGLVLDLRNNSGGLLKQAIDVADMFLTSGHIVSVRSRSRAPEINDAVPSASDYKFPMVVLVNDSSASASEIVASAIQDNKRGLVVGLRTFGKASVQTLFEPALHQHYYIKLTVARYYAPSGQTIQVVGVHPDVEISPELDGKIPVGFREENLNNHLIPIEGMMKSPWAAIVPSLHRCAQESGQAEKIAKREPKPQIHPDYQLLRSADYLNCLSRRPLAAAK